MSASDLISRYGWPRCAKCSKPVDKVVDEFDIVTNETIITVVCHGERETVRLDPESMLVPGVRVRFVEAFVDKRELPAQPGVFITQSGRPPTIIKRETPAIPMPGIVEARLVTSLADFVDVCREIATARPDLHSALLQLSDRMNWLALNKPVLFPLLLTPTEET